MFNLPFRDREVRDIYSTFTHSLNLKPDSFAYSNLNLEYDYIRDNYYDPIFSDNIYIAKDRHYFNNNVYRYGEIVIKSANSDDEKLYNDLIHECFVLDNISESFPNITQTIIDIKLTSDSLYLITAYEEGETLEVYLNRFFLNNTELSDLKRILSTLFENLSRLYSKFKFTHYDLHLQNVILRGVNVIIIDFGTSHINIDDIDYGVMISFEYFPYSLITSTYFWPYDIFKILCLTRDKFDRTIIIEKKKHEYTNLVNYYKSEIKDIRELMEEFKENENELTDLRADLKKKRQERKSALDESREEIRLLEDRMSNPKYIRTLNILISYFLDPEYLSLYKRIDKYYTAIRVDIIEKYNIYYTSYPHFYQFSIPHLR